MTTASIDRRVKLLEAAIGDELAHLPDDELRRRTGALLVRLVEGTTAPALVRDLFERMSSGTATSADVIRCHGMRPAVMRHLRAMLDRDEGAEVPGALWAQWFDESAVEVQR